MKVSVSQLCPTLCDPLDSSPSGFSVHGISQARILEWVAILFSRRSSWPGDQIWASRITGRFFFFFTVFKGIYQETGEKYKVHNQRNQRVYNIDSSGWWQLRNICSADTKDTEAPISFSIPSLLDANPISSKLPPKRSQIAFPNLPKLLPNCLYSPSLPGPRFLT